jgi:BirA family biotin operon repressor/biotin-[acetyl-CoA-carboxylase] ligase
MMQTVRRTLLQYMADGAFHSGESLGGLLGLSRAAVWKHIQALQDEGLAIDSVHGKGYCLRTPLELLDAEQILQRLPATVRKRLILEVFDELPSTNEYLLRPDISKSAGGAPRVCLVERQTAGRGRRGRSWHSPYGTSLAFSLLWRFDGDAGRLAGLSLAVGVCTLEALLRSDTQVRDGDVLLKWPNDLLWRGQKLGGILIEMAGDAAGPCNVVIGIGLNINNRSLAVDAQIDQPWTDLQTVTGRTVSRNRLAAELIEVLCQRLPEFETAGFPAFAAGYRRYDALQGADVSVQRGTDCLQGRAEGVDDLGCLRLRSSDGVQLIHSGEVSLRRLEG